MLQYLLICALKSVICAALFYVYYRLVLRDKRFHYYNRFYLLGAVLISLTVPFLRLQWFTLYSSNTNAIQLLQVINSAGEQEQVIQKSHAGLSPENWLLAGVLLVTMIMLILLVMRVWSLFQLKQRYPVIPINGCSLIHTDLQQAPFSFFRNIFWRTDISLEDKTGRQMLQHELTHVRQRHSWDKLFMQLVLSVCWFNPFLWLIRRELYLVHEFIADQEAIGEKDTSAFAAMLLQATYGNRVFSPAQSFYFSPIKRRLRMLTASGKTRFSYLRRVMALPLFAAMVILFAFRIQQETSGYTIVRANAPFTLVVDAGHGGADDGAIGINGLKEKVINLEISRKIKALSGDYGINVILTRETDIAMTPAEKVNFSNTQQADAFISVHTSVKAPRISAEKSGVEVFISPDNTSYEKSITLGSAVIQSLDEKFTVNKPLMQAATGIWVLKKNIKPAILIEAGFIDNAADVRILTDPAGVEMMARKILEGVVLYANQKVVQPLGVQQAGVQSTDTATPKPAPLYILDGKEIDEATMKKLDPNSIAMVNVWKDENAIGKYGQKGKNGIVEITTKKTGAPVAANTTIDKQDGARQNKDVNTVKDMNNALYVLNGKIIDKTALEAISPDTIATVNVLKDKTATDKYGEKGKNGVIEITTKPSE